MSYCRAAVLADKGKIEVRQVEIPQCKEDGMIIKMEAAAICGTDLHLFEETPQYPFIPGHELCGRIVEMGPKAADSMKCYTGRLKLGDRICIYPWIVCGTCHNCLTYGDGACGVCDNSFVYGVPYESLGVAGSPVRSNSVEESPFLKGGFGEYMYVFPGTYCWQVPEKMPSRVAALLDPMAVAMRAIELAQRAPGIFEDSFNLGATVLITGGGQIATLAAVIARTLGVENIILTGHSDEKLALAKEISGADAVLNTHKLSTEECREIVCSYSHKNGADVVLQCAGSPSAFRQGIDLLKNVGTLIEVGNIVQSRPIEFDPARDLCSKHATYIGMAVNTASCFDKAFHMLCKFEKLGLERIFTHRATLDTLQQVMSVGRREPNYLKGWLDFSDNK